MSATTGPICSVCAHTARSEIDAAIVAGVRTVSALARTYGMSRQSIMRHRDAHLVGDVKGAIARQREDDSYNRGASVLDRMHQLGAEAQAALNAAKNSNDTRLILSAIGTASKLLELQARLTGELKEGASTVNVSVTMNDFRTLQVGIVAALEPYPDAKQAVLRALGADVSLVEAEPIM